MNEITYVINPALKVSSNQSGKVEILLLGENKRVQASQQILEVLDFFRTNRSLADVRQEKINDKVLDFFLLENLIVTKNTLQYHRFGLLKPEKSPVGYSCNINAVQAKEPTESPWCVVGAPFAFDSPVGTDASNGPAAVRNTLKLFNREKVLTDTQVNKNHVITDWNRKKEYKSYTVLPKDLGNIIFNNREERFEDVQRKITYITSEIVERGFKPLIIGGDHSITKPILDTMFEHHKRINVIHFDAHTDRYSEKITNKYSLTRGNVFSEIANHPHLEGLYQIGIREYEPHIKSNEPISNKVRVISSSEVSRSDVADIFDGISKDIPVYLSVDADVFDPTIAPEVSFPVMGGLSFYQMFDLFNYVTTHYEIAGADFVEVSGPAKGKNLAASCMGNLITLLLLNLGGSISNEDNDNY